MPSLRSRTYIVRFHRPPSSYDDPRPFGYLPAAFTLSVAHLLTASLRCYPNGRTSNLLGGTIMLPQVGPKVLGDWDFASATHEVRFAATRMLIIEISE